MKGGVLLGTAIGQQIDQWHDDRGRKTCHQGDGIEITSQDDTEGGADEECNQYEVFEFMPGGKAVFSIADFFLAVAQENRAEMLASAHGAYPSAEEPAKKYRCSGDNDTEHHAGSKIVLREDRCEARQRRHIQKKCNGETAEQSLCGHRQQEAEESEKDDLINKSCLTVSQTETSLKPGSLE